MVWVTWLLDQADLQESLDSLDLQDPMWVILETGQSLPGKNIIFWKKVFASFFFRKDSLHSFFSEKFLVLHVSYLMLGNDWVMDFLIPKFII